ncbi:hypothetical protein AQUCO_02000597v1 [Aquilegia coerulea]|uniref:Pectinesterase n=1 Tax=Aquilegia coerulea TaxID=218851 RepID=A0A2G5DID1_AQUCA|nr:hypothetical protein AQUCO_02000597v1 [Aquilegia coerulea]
MSSNSFKAYGKVNPLDQEYLEARRRTRKRIIIITLSTIVLVAVIVGAVVGTSMQSNGKSNSSKNSAGSGAQSTSSTIKAVCDVTLYPDTCYTSLSQAVNSSHLDPEKLFNVSIQVALQELLRASEHFSKDILEGITGNISVAVLRNCRDVLSLAIDYLNTTLTSSHDVTLPQVLDDVKTWLSAAGTYQQTCLEGFENVTDTVRTTVFEYLKNSTEFTSNSLAIITGLSNVANSFKLRRLLTSTTTDQFPSWLTSHDRKLLQSSNVRPMADAVVAKDGSGKYKTINAALNAVPDKSTKRFVIYVKKGVYYENVRVEKPKWNVLMYGDGKDATIVSGSLNVVDGTPTFSTATFAVFGKGFIGRDMAFRNSAGPSKHQAVALMSSSDETVFYRCRIDAFQDSLYTHALRQFYRECDIFGTVDFIFGNAAVVLQNCNIFPRVPMKGQQNTITAQGKVDPNQNTGIVIQNCTIAPWGDLKSVKTYLGRPWKDYSTTIYMQSMMGNLIDPAGWLPWVGNSAPDTIFYSEYQNYGPGSSTKYRVKWKGLKNINAQMAAKFTVNPFLSGDKWIAGTGVPYKSGL